MILSSEAWEAVNAQSVPAREFALELAQHYEHPGQHPAPSMRPRAGLTAARMQGIAQRLGELLRDGKLFQGSTDGLRVGDVIEWRDGRRKETLRVVELLEGGVRALTPTSAPDKGFLLSKSEIAENVTIMFRGEDGHGE